MSNPEQVNISESMNKADREVNMHVFDIALEDKLEINKLETSIKEMMDYPDYQTIRAEYGNANDFRLASGVFIQSPEGILKGIKETFDRADRQNDEQGARDLEMATLKAKAVLKALADELSERMGYDIEKKRQAGEEIGKESGGDRVIAKPEGLKENMDQVEKLLGAEPRARIEAYDQTNNNLLVRLKQPANASKYIIAKTTYSNLTNGLYLEESSRMLSDNIKKTLARVKDMDPQKTGAEMLKLVKSQLDMLRGIYRILASALTSEPTYQKPPEQKEDIPDNQKITDAEMSQVFDAIFESVRWSKDTGADVKVPTTISEGLSTYYNVGQAYTYYTGRTSDRVGHFDNPILDVTLGTLEAQTLGVMSGGVNAIAGLGKLGVDAVDAATNLAASRVYGVPSDLPSFDEMKTSINEKALGLYVFLKDLPAKMGRNMNFESVKMLGHFISMGFEKTSQAERVMLLNQITSELVSGELLGGGVLEILKSKGLGSLSLKLGKLSTLPGVSTVLRGSTFILSKCQNLTKYGYETEEIVLKLKNAGKAIAKVYDVALDTNDTIGDIQGVYGATAGAVPSAFGKIASEKLKYTPVLKDLLEIKKDISDALRYSAEIGLKEAAVRDLKEQLVLIDHRISSIPT